MVFEAEQGGLAGLLDEVVDAQVAGAVGDCEQAAVVVVLHVENDALGFVVVAAAVFYVDLAVLVVDGGDHGYRDGLINYGKLNNWHRAYEKTRLAGEIWILSLIDYH